MRWVVLALSLVVVSSPAWGAITYDSASSQAASSNAVTYNATIAADANIAVVCVAHRESGGAVQNVASVTVGGANATFLVRQNNAGGVVGVELWYKLAPATGTVEIIATGNASDDRIVSGTMSFKGVAQTNTWNTTDSVSSTVDGTNVDVDDIPSAVGEMGVLCGVNRNEAVTASADGTAPTSTERFDTQSANPGHNGFGYTEDGAADLDMRVDLSGSAAYSAVAASMRAASTRRPIAPMVLQ